MITFNVDNTAISSVQDFRSWDLTVIESLGLGRKLERKYQWFYYSSDSEKKIKNTYAYVHSMSRIFLLYICIFADLILLMNKYHILIFVY